MHACTHVMAGRLLTCVNACADAREQAQARQLGNATGIFFVFRSIYACMCSSSRSQQSSMWPSAGYVAYSKQYDALSSVPSPCLDRHQRCVGHGEKRKL